MTHLTRLLAIVLVSIAFLVVGCSCDGTAMPRDGSVPEADGAPRADSGIDSGIAIDSGIDSGPDSGIDAAIDANLPDTGPEGPPDVALVPPPPAYWVVEAFPVALTVGGTNVSHYRWRIDGGAWSADATVATPLSLGVQPAGWRWLELSGRNASGTWQTDPLRVRFYATTTARETTACTMRAAGGTCDFLIPASDTVRRYYATAAATPFGWETVWAPEPGARICIEHGRHRTLNFRGFSGTAEEPLTFINCGGQAEVRLGAGDNGTALNFEGSSFLRIVGVGSADERGIVVDSTPGGGGNNAIELAIGTSDFEIAYVEVRGALYGGITARTNVSCTHHDGTFVQENTFLHHNYVHDTVGEAFYVGGSHWASRQTDNATNCGMSGHGTTLCDGTCVFEAELHGVRLYANHAEDIESDGIQLSSARSDDDLSDGRVDWDTEVHHNLIVRAATGGSDYNSGSMAIQGGTSGRVYANLIQQGGGYAGMFVGCLALFAYDNIIDGATSVAVAVQENDPAGRVRSFVFVNNTFINPGGSENFYIFDRNSMGNLLMNNLLLGGTIPVRLNWAAVQLTQDHNVIGSASDAHFVDRAGGDYRLLATSTAVGAGADASSHGVLTDYYGTAWSVPYDVGAARH